MLPIYVDLDDVIADTARYFISCLEREFGKTVRFEQVTSFDLKKSFHLSDSEYDYFFRLVHQPAEVLRLQPIEGAIEVLSQWVETGHTVEIVTGRLTSAYDPTIEWLAVNQVPYHKFTMVDKYARPDTNHRIACALEDFCTRKFRFAIEDSPKMTRFLTQEMKTDVILFDRPWNRGSKFNGHVTRLKTWKEIATKVENTRFIASTAASPNGETS